MATNDGGVKKGGFGCEQGTPNAIPSGKTVKNVTRPSEMMKTAEKPIGFGSGKK
jgi:hypothetical protein